jgi:hypothetical protein
VQNADVERAHGAGLSQLSEAIANHRAQKSPDGGAVIPTFRPGEVVGAMVRLARDGEPLDATDVFDLTWGELEGRRRAEEAMEFLHSHMPGFEDAFLADTATQQGVRETRHIVGEYTLTGNDVARQARFDDAVLQAAWPQEYHVSGRSTEYRFFPDGDAYDIPFGCLVPAGDSPPNLLVAGRCISAEHDALASCRVMAPCFAMGEAAGVAAAMAACDPALSAVGSIEVSDVRAVLVEHGAVLRDR